MQKFLFSPIPQCHTHTKHNKSINIYAEIRKINVFVDLNVLQHQSFICLREIKKKSLIVVVNGEGGFVNLGLSGKTFNWKRTTFIVVAFAYPFLK